MTSTFSSIYSKSYFCTVMAIKTCNILLHLWHCYNCFCFVFLMHSDIFLCEKRVWIDLVSLVAWTTQQSFVKQHAAQNMCANELFHSHSYPSPNYLSYSLFPLKQNEFEYTHHVFCPQLNRICLLVLQRYAGYK